LLKRKAELIVADYVEIAKQALKQYRAQQEATSDRRPFPHCPKCLSCALYRADNSGNYECQSCGEIEITPEIARRVV
jgi:ribosomal protein L37AE/L43A